MRAMAAVLGLLLFGAAPPQETVDTRAAVRKALPLLEKSAAVARNERSCFTCHHQAAPMIGLTHARRRGFEVDPESYQAILRHTAASLDRSRKPYQEGKGQGGQADTAGYGLWTLEAGGWKPDATTAAVAEYLILHHQDREAWRVTSSRPPSEASSFTTTFLAILALRTYATTEQKERAARRIERARGWLLSNSGTDTEDRVFRLWALKYADAGEEDVRSAAADLRGSQREDGGWGQTSQMESDAYATATALVALHEAADVRPADPAYRRGVGYLLRAQGEDGSWHVKTRSRPIQTYFESGFPHGKDQFISISATSWAVAALAFACPK